MATIRCPHCQTDNQPELTGALCRHCGDFLPGQAALAPARISSPETQLHQERSGVRDQQAAARKSVAVLLFAVAVVQLTCGCVDFVISPDWKGMRLEAKQTMLIVMIGMVVGSSLLFAGLGWLAFYQPLSAALTGFVAWTILSIAVVVLTPEAIWKVLTVNLPLLLGLGQGVHASYQAFYRRPDGDAGS